ATWGAVEYGEAISGPDYLKSMNTVHATGRQLARFFENHDVLVTAALAEPPARLGRFAMTNGNFIDYRLGPNGIVHYSPFTAIFNITGQPAISLPLHWSRSGLPVGVHFAGAFGDEETLLKLSAQLEQARPWMNRRPALSRS
ncbi:MAG: amidase family protein, partial [Dongiaceae bacterium]